MTTTFENLANELFGSFLTNISSPISSPSHEVRKETDYYILDVLIPGYDKSDIDLNTEGDIILISYNGEEKGLKKKFEKRFRAKGDVNLDNIEASIKNGVLSIKVPLKEKLKSKKVKIL